MHIWKALAFTQLGVALPHLVFKIHGHAKVTLYHDYNNKNNNSSFICLMISSIEHETEQVGTMSKASYSHTTIIHCYN